jgi:hypothetical protein
VSKLAAIDFAPNATGSDFGGGGIATAAVCSVSAV